MDLQLYFAVYIYSDLTIINNDLIELFWNIKQRGEGMSEVDKLRLRVANATDAELDIIFLEFISDLPEKDLTEVQGVMTDFLASQLTYP